MQNISNNTKIMCLIILAQKTKMYSFNYLD